MTISFRPAVREQTSLMIGIAGPSSSGKTFSALRLATGLAEGGPIYFIDTESGRGKHYADTFKYEYGELSAPFEPTAHLEAIQKAREAGARVIIVDSMSHEHEGPGGILEMHEAILDNKCGNDWKKRERMNFSAWIEPKKQHNRFVNGILQLGTGVHVIFCFRAKQKLMLDKKGNSYEIPKEWSAICATDFQYEMTALLMLPPGSEGVPDLSIPATKLQEQHKGIVRQGAQISEEMGQQFAAWANGGAKPANPSQQAPADQTDDQQDGGMSDPEKIARDVATMGTDRLAAHWKRLAPATQRLLEPIKEELKGIAAKADNEGEGVDLFDEGERSEDGADANQQDSDAEAEKAA